MTPRTRLLLALLITFVWAISVSGQAPQSWPRFHRYAQTRLDDTTTLDMVKDAKTGVCRLVYRVKEGAPHEWRDTTANRAIAVTYLGEVPCDPAPVPVLPPPPASAVR